MAKQLKYGEEARQALQKGTRIRERDGRLKARWQGVSMYEMPWCRQEGNLQNESCC